MRHLRDILAANAELAARALTSWGALFDRVNSRCPVRDIVRRHRAIRHMPIGIAPPPDYGLPDEALTLVKELAAAGKLPIVGVVGIHDFESGKHQEVFDILCEAGVKGSGGGLGRGALGCWGEETMKAFVREASDEALKLESALARLRTKKRIVVLHYAPVRAHVEGEPAEIIPLLGSSRLEEPIVRYGVNAVFHGHAHHGHPEGRIRDGVPMYNVSLLPMRATFPHRAPFRILTLPAPGRRPVADAQHQVALA